MEKKRELGLSKFDILIAVVLMADVVVLGFSGDEMHAFLCLLSGACAMVYFCVRVRQELRPKGKSTNDL